MKTVSKTLLKVSRRAQSCVGRIVQKHNLTIAEQPFLLTIRFQDGLTQEELSELVGVDRALTTRVIQSLEKKGLIRKERDARDRRYHHIFANDALYQLADTIIPELFAFNDAATAGISQEELAQMVHTLQRLESNISNYIKVLDAEKARR